MEMEITRRDLGYTVISRFEETFRNFISEKITLIYPSFLDGIPSGVITKAKERASSAIWPDPEDLLDNIDFTDLSEITCFNNSFNKYFPNSYNQKQFEETMGELYTIRCKIAHSKQHFSYMDMDKLVEGTRSISAFFGLQGISFNQIITALLDNPINLAVHIPVSFMCQDDQIQVSNNIPIPDYDYEGGFVGRDEDIRKIISLLEGDLHRVITISGAGGVGKTALAIRVVQKILVRSKKKFDGIVWLSAKESKLSYLGIEDLEPTIKSYEELLDAIFQVMGFGNPSDDLSKKETDVQTIFDLIDAILIVIDNLETITDERIINFILDIHPKVKVLITSRKGLGQVERRYELKQLKEREAITLFRIIAREKNLDKLVKLDDETIRTYVKKLACYPLAIKWVIGNVAIGKDINKIINKINETTSDISKFCFDQIFNSLSDDAKKVLYALSIFEEPPSAGVLGFVVDLDQTRIEDVIQELILVSLVIPEQSTNEKGDITTQYSILSLTRGYVKQKLDNNHSIKNGITQRLQRAQSFVEEAERAKKQYRFSLANLGANSDEEKIAAMIAQVAFQKYQSGRYADAVEDYKRAQQIAPRFASLYRNWAVMEAQEGHAIESEQLMQKASELSPNDPQIWLTWGNIKRRADKVKEAHQKYEIAYKLSPGDGVILNAFGQAKARLGDYIEADKLFNLALKTLEPSDSHKNRIINLSSLADNLVRWAESLEKDGDLSSTESKLLSAQDYCKEALQLDNSDIISQDLYRKIQLNLGFTYKRVRKLKEAIEHFAQAIVNKPIAIMRTREARDTIIASLQYAKILYSIGKIDQAKKVLSPEFRKIFLGFPPTTDLKEEFENFRKELSSAPEMVEGKIIRVEPEKGFVIIETLTLPIYTYFGHINNFVYPIENISESMLNKLVTFAPCETRSNNNALRYEARMITLEDD